ncbi:MAG: MarR family EPS-associated transcriptional regulator [Hydrogenovibrio sp.]|uniref:MarR family EPS-associated transcriptional regulator n=1 Tax=Hydrogenovibrio sp. TaxID=2065821 RepID=UPI0028705F64|nr:MarR family EPS-associated transcriptional regulator [Hydrogenovibrio sp.]MDR9498504.1 MarR family EPS-associated transcriptional regulator [Hydrogenovibrio sp.]MDR9499266.1 MarR family EPS-associated transcriptional regulator [Hydrogenovibrio sp.]
MENTETLLKVLQHAPEQATQRSLAKKLGCSLGKTNYIVKAVMAKGLIKAERFASSDKKWHYRYVLTPEGIAERIKITEHFVQRKKQEYEQLCKELQTLKNDKH